MSEVGLADFCHVITPALDAPDGHTVCLIAPENAASVRVAEKCGFGGSGTVLYKGRASLVLERRVGRYGRIAHVRP